MRWPWHWGGKPKRSDDICFGLYRAVIVASFPPIIRARSTRRFRRYRRDGPDKSFLSRSTVMPACRCGSRVSTKMMMRAILSMGRPPPPRSLSAPPPCVPGWVRRGDQQRARPMPMPKMRITEPIGDREHRSVDDLRYHERHYETRAIFQRIRRIYRRLSEMQEMPPRMETSQGQHGHGPYLCAASG